MGRRARLHLWRCRRLRVRGAIQVTRTWRHDRRRALEPSSTRRDGVISDRGWNRKFEDPIPLPRGRQLVTLEDAARFIQKLPKAEQQIEEWQTAVEALLLVVNQNGPTMFARIGVMRCVCRKLDSAILMVKAAKDRS